LKYFLENRENKDIYGSKTTLSCALFFALKYDFSLEVGDLSKIAETELDGTFKELQTKGISSQIISQGLHKNSLLF